MVFGFWALSSCAGASLNIVSTDNLSSSVNENQKVNFTIEISDYPRSSEYRMSIDTSLLNTGETPLFNLFSLNELNKNVDRYKNEIIIPVPSESKFTVQISGQVPQVVDYNQRNNFTQTIYYPGPYLYYDVKLLDQYGNIIDSRKSNSYFVYIKEIKDFDEKLNKITAPQFKDVKAILTDLHNKGVISESNALADALLMAQNQFQELPEENKQTIIGHYTILDLGVIFFVALVFSLIGYRLRGNS